MKQNYLFLFVLFFLCKSLGFGQIVNKGILQIETSTIVYFGDEYTNKSTGTHNNDGNLYLNDNFINNGTTTVPTSGTTYFNSTVNAIQSISGATNSANFFNLEVDNSLTGVSVDNNFGLIVANNVNLTDGDLRLVDEAQLIQNQTLTGIDTNTAGTGKLLRDQQGISTTTGYNYWSSPVNNVGTFALNGGLFDGTDANANNGINSFTPQPISFNYPGLPYDGFPAVLSGGNVTTPLFISERWLYTYPPSSAGYAGWDKIYKDSPINPGEGFTMKGTGVENQNYVFKGTPNNGDYTFPIIEGQSALLGNPYPSALNSVEFINNNISLLDMVEFWVDGGSDSHYLSDYLGGYAIQNLTGITTPSVPSGILGIGTASGLIPKQYIAVGQGFFVEATGDGTIVFNNAQRDFITEASGISVFYKASNTKSNLSKSNALSSYIRIGYEDPEKFHRQLLLGFMPDSPADLYYNRGYDALMLSPREDELFFIIDNDLTKKYVIQGVNAFDENNEFALGLMMTEAGVHTIMLDAVENFTGKVYIKDVLADVTYDLTAGNFCPNLPPGTYLERFKLVFKDKYAVVVVVVEDVTPNQDFSVENTTVKYHENGSLIVRIKNDLQVNSISIYNILGQQIKLVNGDELDKNVIAIPFQYPKGVYIVVVDSELGNETFKIINK
jgi:hypothetical protein